MTGTDAAAIQWDRKNKRRRYCPHLCAEALQLCHPEIWPEHTSLPAASRASRVRRLPCRLRAPYPVFRTSPFAGTERAKNSVTSRGDAHCHRSVSTAGASVNPRCAEKALERHRHCPSTRPFCRQATTRGSKHSLRKACTCSLKAAHLPDGNHHAHAPASTAASATSPTVVPTCDLDVLGATAPLQPAVIPRAYCWW